MLNVQHISLEHCSFESYTHWDSAVVLDAHDVMRCIKTYNQTVPVESKMMQQ